MAFSVALFKLFYILYRIVGKHPFWLKNTNMKFIFHLINVYRILYKFYPIMKNENGIIANFDFNCRVTE